MRLLHFETDNLFMRLTFLLVVWFLGFWVTGLQAQSSVNEVSVRSDGSVLLENFEEYEPGTIPKYWYNQKGERRPALYSEKNKADYKYRVKEENGNKFLRYSGIEAKHLNFPLVDKGLNIYETPILSWKWRVFELPDGANEDDDDRNDTAASIYVVFDMGRIALFKKVPKTIRYTWSSTLQKGKELSKFYGNQKIVVVESGPQNKGKWITFERNIVEDYKQLFGDPPPKNPIAILILSDGNSTESYVKADYDDIILKPEKGAQNR